jgi:Tfp pilus assembly protein PilX
MFNTNFKIQSFEKLRIGHERKSKGQSGVSLYFAIVVMAILLAIGFGLSTIIISQMRTIRGMGDSVIAFYAADTGIERALYALYKEGTSLPFNFLPPTCTDCYLDLNNNAVKDADDATYSVSAASSTDPICSGSGAQYYCLKSIGNFKEVTRAIEAAY